jgi:hypothetical protein
MNIYKQRWNKAKQLANEINDRYEKAIKEYGNKCILMYREILEDANIVIYDDQIILHVPGANFILFIDDPEQDMGSLSTIKEIEELFDEINILVPYKG